MADGLTFRERMYLAGVGLGGGDPASVMRDVEESAMRRKVTEGQLAEQRRREEESQLQSGLSRAAEARPGGVLGSYLLTPGEEKSIQQFQRGAENYGMSYGHQVPNLDAARLQARLREKDLDPGQLKQLKKAGVVSEVEKGSGIYAVNAEAPSIKSARTEYETKMKLMEAQKREAEDQVWESQTLEQIAAAKERGDRREADKLVKQVMYRTRRDPDQVVRNAEIQAAGLPVIRLLAARAREDPSDIYSASVSDSSMNITFAGLSNKSSGGLAGWRSASKDIEDTLGKNALTAQKVYLTKGASKEQQDATVNGIMADVPRAIASWLTLGITQTPEVFFTNYPLETLQAAGVPMDVIARLGDPNVSPDKKQADNAVVVDRLGRMVFKNYMDRVRAGKPMEKDGLVRRMISGGLEILGYQEPKAPTELEAAGDDDYESVFNK